MTTMAAGHKKELVCTFPRRLPYNPPTKIHLTLTITDMFKFRGSSKKNGTRLYGSFLQLGQECFVVPAYPLKKAFDLCDYLVEPNTVGQFTGITDQDGQEIYTGDVVQIEGVNEAFIVVLYEAAFSLATVEQFQSLNIGEHPFVNDYARLRCLGDFEIQGLLKVTGNTTEMLSLSKLLSR